MRTTNPKTYLLMSVLLLGALCTTAVGRTIYVDAEASILADAQHNSLNRDADPVVIAGNKLRALNWRPVDNIVGFRFQDSWEQIPIQIDERKYVDFRVVYDNPPVGHGILAYTDPNTYVGPDTDPDFDSDDELVFMAKDAGNLAPLSGDFPVGVLEESRVEIQIHDPLDDAVAYVYLFESDGSLRPDAGRDYVAYEFRLLNGSYFTHYQKGQGYNPEDSNVQTDAYQTHFSDRFIRDELRILAGSATGLDILDRHKFGRGPGDCSRNMNTASEGEGVFFTNKDGCVRAIRSYMGYNSGPYIQRDHFFYQQRHDIDTYWRVHVATGGRNVYDYSPDAKGMTYYNDINPDGVIIDGEPDNVSIGSINWEMITGHQGTIIMCHSMDTDIPLFETSSYYSDDETPELTQCTGDEYEFGVSGIELWNWPNTDPVLGVYNNLTFHRIVFYEAPDQTVDTASVRHQQAMSPLEVTVTALNPPPPVFVDDDAPNDEAPDDPTISDPNEDGSAEHPFDAIQEAIDYAVDGETVIVLAGTYTGDGNRDLDFKGKAITVRSTNPNVPKVMATTVIDCNGTVANPHRGFEFHSGETSLSVLAGLTITNGNAEYGGGIYCRDESSPTITNCMFIGNSAIYTMGRGQRGDGGGISCQNSNPTLANCTFSDNSANNYGGGIYNEDRSNPTLTNCTFSGNSASLGGGMYNDNSSPTVTNCIIWGNTGGQIAGSATVSYSDLEGGWQGEGNIDVDPYFADPNNGDYHLKSQAGRWDANERRWTKDDVTSPCIDAGDMSSPIGLEPFPSGGIVNMGAYGGTTEASKSYFGEPVCETIVAGDINGDCKVDFKDFVIMAAHWLEKR